MKKTFLIITFCLVLFACANGRTKDEARQPERAKSDVVEVLYFHGEQRCLTCRAIEKETKALVATVFQDEVKSGRLVFRSLDIDENEALADKYQVTWSSLVLVDYDAGREKADNITKFAFSNVRKSPEVFRSVLTDKIRKMLD